MHRLEAACVAAATMAFAPGVGWAQQTTGARADSLQAGLDRVSARLDSLAAGQCPAAAAIATPEMTGNARTDSLAAALGRLAARLEETRKARCGPGAAQPSPVPETPNDTTDELAALRAAAGEAVGRRPPPGAVDPSDTVPAAPAPADTSARPAGRRSTNLLNPDISATGDVRLIARDENPPRDNAIAREFEFSFQSDLDPFSKTKIYMTFENEEVGIEEGYIYWSGLPGRIRADVGKFRQSIGDLNRWHLHALPETEYPLVYQRYLGEEGLSGIGVSLYTALPVSLAGGTHELTIQGTTSESEPLYDGGRQPTLLGRLQNFWQLSRSSYAQLGFTATGGNNADADLHSRLLGADFRFTYRPPQSGNRRDITFRAEGYRLHASEAGDVTNRYGTFLDLQVRRSQRWVFGARYDWVESPRGARTTEWRITPAITWWQSEFVYLRLQGEHGRRDPDGTQNQLTLQAVWAVGPHKHETY